VEEQGGQPGRRRLVGIDLGIASRHSVRVLEADGQAVCRSSCVPTVESLALAERAALAGAPEGTRLAVVFEPTGPAWMPIAVFFARRGHDVYRVSSAKAADLRRFLRRQVADLLHGPRTIWVPRDAEDVHVTAADLHDEQAVQPLLGHRAVHVEEVGGEHRGCLGVQELPPGRVGVPLRCRGDLQGLEDPADGGRADPVAEFQQFALDPPVPPAVILGGEPLDQRGDLGIDRRPSCAVRVGPLAGDEAAVPAQDGTWGDQPVHPQPWRQQPDQRCEDRAVGPVEPGPGMRPAQHGDLVTQHEQLGVLGCR
jgi:hypothetical protein